MGKGRPPICKACGKKLDIDTAFMFIKHTASGKEYKEFYCNKEECEKKNKITIQEICNKTNQDTEVQLDTSKNTGIIKKPRKKRKANPYLDKVYNYICEILGEEKIINTILWKEKVIWNSVATDKIIGNYLEENRDWLVERLNNIDGSEFARIRYLSSIIKNNIKDYKDKNPDIQIKKENNIEYFDNITYKSKKKRRSLEELEDEIE